jgi:hypothetical protein
MQNKTTEREGSTTEQKGSCTQQDTIMDLSTEGIM